jgi:Pyridine nucleotide-disulphide oxidoreductase
MEYSPRRRRVLILGSGFGGLTVAMELEKGLGRDSSVEVTLVNRENFFLFTPMLHEVAASDLDLTTIVNPVRKLLRSVHFLQGRSIRSISSKGKSSFPTVSTIITTRLSLISWSSAWVRLRTFMGFPGCRNTR